VTTGIAKNCNVVLLKNSRFVGKNYR